MADSPVPPVTRRESPRTLVLLAAGGALLVLAPMLLRLLVMEAFKVPSPAMMPTLLVGDHFFVSKLPFRPRRGEVILFRYPLDPSVDYVKRVVALAGDTVQLRDGHLSINGVDLSRPAPSGTCEEALEGEPALDWPCEVWAEGGGSYPYQVIENARHDPFGPFTVPPATVFVLGDNRPNSSDSRAWGAVPLANVKGSALYVWWSSGGGGVRWNRIFHSIR